MILPIYIYPESVLREPAGDVDADSEEVQELVDDMLETMKGAAGIGLAATQVGKSLRIFVVDLSSMAEDLAEEGEVLPEQPMVFINPEILDESETLAEYEEGCLSIPDIREVVERPDSVRMRYLDRAFEEREVEFSGLLARVIQHEYDHLEGVLFIDLVSAFRRRLLRRRLRELGKGLFETEYPVVQTIR